MALFARGPHRVGCDGALELDAGAAVTFDTYFNAFDVQKWRRHTVVQDLSFGATAAGDLRLEIVHETADGTRRPVASESVSSTEPIDVDLPIPGLAELGDGQLFLRAIAGAGARLCDARWQTVDPPAREVRLGLVITTFRSPEDVRRNLTTLAEALDSRGGLGDSVDVVVVDNGCSLERDDVGGEHVTLLANPNLGGAGGFARGLAHLRTQGRATHVLFMDDDVSFDPDLVARIVAVLSRARDPRLCIAGAMLEREHPTVLFEAGARYFGCSLDTNRPIGHGLQLDRWDDVVRAGEEHEPIDYGAWWCFAFPIDLTDDNPLPMFLRGDDVAWGLLHAGHHTVTFPGVGLWHDEFERKTGPVMWFYETRNLALIGCLAFPEYSSRHLLLRYLNQCARSLFGLQYVAAGHITWAMREFLAGPSHWMALDQSALHASVSAFEGEKVAPLSPGLGEVPDMPRLEGAARVLAAAASLAVLGGHLLPARFDRRPLRALQLGERALGAAPGHDALLYRDRDHTHGFVVRRDRRRFARLFGQMVTTAARIPFAFPRVRRAYEEAYPRMVSDDYWRSQFCDDEASPVGP
jgi:GT2 family glycosyltransferase